VSGFTQAQAITDRPVHATLAPADLSDVRGQDHARWALEVALAGGHNLLLTGPPGAGKTLLARTIPALLPPLDDQEAQDVAVIQSVAGLQPRAADRMRPFRAPHHTSSYAAMVGGGPLLAPGLVSLAHHGVLFLDELAEFDRDVLDALRQPLEDGSVEIARAHGSVRYPAQLQLVAATNPCRCGWYGDAERPCRCPRPDAERYLRRVSGPLLDRIDLHVTMPRLDPSVLLEGPPGEASSVVAERIARARSMALARNGGVVNARLAGRRLEEACAAERTALRLLAELGARGAMSARGLHRVLRIARTIADLEGRPKVFDTDVSAAAGVRNGERAEAFAA
jgi:magnesium chelatase family protein